MQNPITLNEKAEKAIQVIMKRSLTDSDFRKQCLTSGNEVLEEITGTKLPEGVTFKFAESNESVQVLTLPEFLGDGAELSDDELEDVAGGASALFLCNEICNEICNGIVCNEICNGIIMDSK